MKENIHGLFDIEDHPTSERKPMETSIAKELKELPVLSPTCSIFKIPVRLRMIEENAYAPKIVSIGPLHHGANGLKDMEEHKRRYLKDFIERIPEDLGFESKLGRYTQLVQRNEERLRACYAEVIKFNSGDFVKIILIDAVFIIGVLLRNKFPILRDTSDRIYRPPWMLKDVVYDMLMLENQLPFFILNELYESWKIKVPFTVAGDSTSDGWPSILKLSHCLFKDRLILDENTIEGEDYPSQVEHFVDFLRSLHLRFLNLRGEEQGQGQGNGQGLGLEQGQGLGLEQGQEQGLEQELRGKLQTIKSPTMTELHNAGVKFKVGRILEFKEGILKIPRLQFKGSTEVLISNIVAFEQCFCLRTDMIYFFTVIYWLVNSEKDVDLLVKYGILDNFKGDNKEVSSFINKFGDGVSLETHEFPFTNLCKDLNTYCKTSWHKWKAILIRNYLNTPWAIISLVAGVILLILTLIQTVFSII